MEEGAHESGRTSGEAVAWAMSETILDKTGGINSKSDYKIAASER